MSLASSAANATASGVKWQALTAALLVALVVLQYRLWLAEDGVRQTYALRVANQAQTEENATLNERNRAMEADVVDLKSGLMAIEERARSEMGMIRPDETFYRILDRPLPKPAEVVPLKPGAPAHKSPALAKPAPARPPAAKPPAPVKPAVAKPSALPASVKPVAAKPPAPAQPPAAANPAQPR